MSRIFNACFDIFYYCAEWFYDMLDAMDLLGIYFGYVFVAMVTGFLLKRFGSALSLGSDQAANKFKRKGDE